MTEMEQQALIYSFVARGEDIIAEFAEFTGSFIGTAAQCLQKLPASINNFTYNSDGHTFNYLVEDGFVYGVVAAESVGIQVPIAFLELIKEEFTKEYGGGKAAIAAANNLNVEFGPKLKEKMQYCVDDLGGISKRAKVKDQVSGVKEVMGENIEMSVGQHALVYSFVARGTDILAEYAEFAGSFIVIASQFLEKLPASINNVTYDSNGHTFNYLFEDGFAYCVVAVKSVGRKIRTAFLERIKEDFTKLYGGGKAATAVASSLNREFGPKLKEQMQYCVDHLEKINKHANVKDQFSEVKALKLENTEKMGVKIDEILTMLSSIKETVECRQNEQPNHEIMSLREGYADFTDIGFDLEDVLGCSNFFVYQVKDKSNVSFALKAIPLKDKELSRHMVREISLMLDIEHDNVVRLEHVFVHGKNLCLLMQLADCDLNQHIQMADHISLMRIKKWLMQIVSAVKYLHERNIIHRDLKSENILMYGDVVKLADFGFSRSIYKDAVLSPQVTTIHCRAPEMLLGEDYTPAVDMWSIGCIFYEMVKLEVLFDARGDVSEAEMIEKIYELLGTADGLVVEGLEPDGLDLLRRLLCLDPKLRISAEDALKHSFLSSQLETGFADLTAEDLSSQLETGLSTLTAETGSEDIEFVMEEAGRGF